ncbi:MAG: hypothetical protein ACPG7F_15740 [Aggregatilineales bacterium]
MGIEIRWHNAEKTILYQQIEGRWTIADFRDAVEKINTLLDSISHPVYRISHIHGRLFVPRNITGTFRAAVISHRPHERTHYIVGGGLMINAVLSTMRLLDPAPERDFIQVETLAAAEAQIQQQLEDTP